MAHYEWDYDAEHYEIYPVSEKGDVTMYGIEIYSAKTTANDALIRDFTLSLDDLTDRLEEGEL